MKDFVCANLAKVAEITRRDAATIYLSTAEETVVVLTFVHKKARGVTRPSKGRLAQEPHGQAELTKDETKRGNYVKHSKHR